MTIEITALDTLFFRDGKPFTMGDDTWATGIFPPLPSVFYGMIRTTYAAQNDISINDIEEQTKYLEINSIHLKLEDDIIFQYPEDLFSTVEMAKDKKANTLTLIKNTTLSNINKSEYPYLLTTDKNEKVKDFSNKAFLSNNTFDEYLEGGKEHFFNKFDDYISSEAKIGIGKDLDTNITSKSKLYRVGMKRLEFFDAEKEITKKIRILIDFEHLKLDKTGIVKLGAEGKVAQYKEINKQIVPSPKITEYLKIYLATPAILNDGELPEFIKNKKYKGIDFELLTYAIGKPVYVGGFDMKQRKPKPMKKAVPAGSVYYLKSDNAQKLANELHGKSISEQLQEQGFGICYCGTFNI